MTLLADVTERPGGPAVGAKLQHVETLQRIPGERTSLAWDFISTDQQIPTHHSVCRVVKIHIIKSTSSFSVWNVCWALRENVRIQVKKRAGADVSGEGTGCAKALGSSGDLGAWVTGGADLRASEGHGRSRRGGGDSPLSFCSCCTWNKPGHHLGWGLGTTGCWRPSLCEMESKTLAHLPVA